MSLELRARAAAATLEVFGFNPDQRRGPDGRWVKMGGAGSAGGRPRSRRAALRRAGRAIGSLVDGQAGVSNGPLPPELADQIRDVFKFGDPSSGLQTRPRMVLTNFDQSNPAGREVSVFIGVHKPDGTKVGDAVRTFRRNPRTGELFVDHVSFHLEEGARGGGLSSRWLPEMEKRYRDMGVESIHLKTSNVGGYAWAKAGFDFASDSDAVWLSDQIREYADVYPPPPQVRDQLEALTTRVRGGEDDRPLPLEFAMLGWEPGASDWFGKRAMVGTDWNGVKDL